MNNTNNGYVSLDVIANKIYKNPLLKDLNYEDIIDFALSVIRIAKVPGVYKEESCFKEITNHKVLIPKSALNVKAVDYCMGNRQVPMRMATFSIHNQIDKLNIGNINNDERIPEYSIDNQMITTTCKSGKIFIVFDTIKTDEDDIPMIPNSEPLLRAIEAYIKVQVYSVLVDLGKLPERALNRVEQEYYFTIAQAQSEYKSFKNEDEMESFLNGWKRTFITGSNHNNRYSSESDKEHLRRL